MQAVASVLKVASPVDSAFEGEDIWSADVDFGDLGEVEVIPSVVGRLGETGVACVTVAGGNSRTTKFSTVDRRRATGEATAEEVTEVEAEPISEARFPFT